MDEILVVTKKMREANVIPMMTWMRVEVMKTVARNDDDDMEKEIIYELIDPNGTNKDDHWREFEQKQWSLHQLKEIETKNIIT